MVLVTELTSSLGRKIVSIPLIVISGPDDYHQKIDKKEHPNKESVGIGSVHNDSKNNMKLKTNSVPSVRSMICRAFLVLLEWIKSMFGLSNNI